MTANRCSLILLASLCLTACTASEDRINEAIPLDEATVKAKAALDRFNEAPERAAESAATAAELHSRLKVRALTCAKGYSPNFLTSTAQIREKLTDKKCFEDSDRDLRSWINRKRVGLLLAFPPLRPVPAEAPRFIVSSRNTGGFTFAEKAGIALTSYGRSVQVLDIATGQALFDEEGASEDRGGGRLSANGRLFIGGSVQGPVIRDAETGERLLEFTNYETVRWLDDRHALVRKRSDNRETLLIDFSSGEETPIMGVDINTVFGVAPLPGPSLRFVLSGHRAMQTIEVLHRAGALEARLIAEKPQENPGIWTDNTGDRSADGKLYFNAIQDLVVTTLESLHTATYRLNPFYAQAAVPTPDNDEVIVTGFLKDTRAVTRGAYLVSLKDLTIAPVDETLSNSGTFIYIRSLNKNGILRNGRVQILDAIAHGSPVPLDQQTAIWRAAVIESATAQVSEFPATSTSLRSSANSPLGILAKDATVEAVGVYEAENSVHGFGKPSKTGDVTVIVRRSRKPLVLVLSSYEPIRWKIVRQSGAQLALILVSSSGTGEVSGAESVRTVVIGRNYAYQRGSNEYSGLESAVTGTIGKGIGIFQGTYKGAHFVVGGLE